MQRFIGGCLRWVFALFLVASACAVVAQLAASGDLFTQSRSSRAQKATATKYRSVAVAARPTARSTMPAINRSDKPSQVTDAHISEYQQIQQQASSGQISKSQARSRLENLAIKVGKNGLAWLTRCVPIKDSRTGQWVSFDTYAKTEAQNAGFRPDSRFAKDPVGTTADLMFGDYPVEDFVYENFDLGPVSGSGQETYPTPTINARVGRQPTIRPTPFVNTVKTKVKSGIDTAKTQVDTAKTKVKNAADAAKTQAKSGVDKVKDWLDGKLPK